LASEYLFKIKKPTELIEKTITFVKPEFLEILLNNGINL